MGKATVLRILKGSKLTEEQYANIKEILGVDKKHLTIEEIKDDAKASYERRIASLEEGFRYLLNAFGKANNKELDTFLNWSKQNCKFPAQGESDEYEKILSKYSACLIDKASSCLSLEKHDVKELINKAEQYLIMTHGRPDVATLIPCEVYNDGDMVLMWDRQIFPCTDETMKELHAIKASDLGCTPAWFRKLPLPKQLYYNRTPATTLLELTTDLRSLIKKINSIPGISPRDNALPSSCIEGMSEFHQVVMHAMFAEYRSLGEVVKNLEAMAKEIEDMQSGVRNSIRSSLLQIRKVPYWFLTLSESEQKLLKYALKKAKGDLRETFSFLPSRLTTLPGQRNFGETITIILNENGEEIKRSKPQRHSSHPASRTVVNPLVAKEGLRRNIDLIIEMAKGNPILLATLVSPFWTLSELTPDYKLHEQLKNAITELRKNKDNPLFYFINYPLNKGRLLLPTAVDNPECLKLIEDAYAKMKKLSASEKKEFKPLIEAFQEALRNASFLSDTHARELCLSSLAGQIILYMDGISYGGCVSGKDRKNVQLLHTQAMWIYYEKYHKWPRITDQGENRENFCVIVARLYLSRHGQYLADQNAPGAYGIKNPRDYFPEDICAKIEELRKGMLDFDDKIAATNEFANCAGEVPNSFYRGKEFTSHIQAALKLSKSNREDILSILQIILGESWKGKTTNVCKKAPTGIQKIRHQFEKVDDNIEALAIAFECANKRLSTWVFFRGRDESTKQLYMELSKLCDNPTDAQATETLNFLKKLKDEFFEENKKHLSEKRHSPELK